MTIVSNIIFSVIIALLLLHEMDAIKNEEWKMFIFFRGVSSKNSYRIFTILHLPLYTILIFLLINKVILIMYIIDIFLIIHSILHIFFEKHSKNGLKNTFSRILIHLMVLLAIVHLVLINYN